MDQEMAKGREKEGWKVRSYILLEICKAYPGGIPQPIMKRNIAKEFDFKDNRNIDRHIDFLYQKEKLIDKKNIVNKNTKSLLPRQDEESFLKICKIIYDFGYLDKLIKTRYFVESFTDDMLYFNYMKFLNAMNSMPKDIVEEMNMYGEVSIPEIINNLSNTFVTLADAKRSPELLALLLFADEYVKKIKDTYEALGVFLKFNLRLIEKGEGQI